MATPLNHQDRQYDSRSINQTIRESKIKNEKLWVNGYVESFHAHEHWHIDISYTNICGTFYYLCSLLDGFSRYIVHWEIRETMTEADVEKTRGQSRMALP